MATGFATIIVGTIFDGPHERKTALTSGCMELFPLGIIITHD